MNDEALLDLHRRHQETQAKYIYFLLAITASAVAFAIQKTSDHTLTSSLIPLAIAVLFWGCSFYFGCRHLVWVQAALRANYALLQLKSGVHPDQPQQQDHLNAAISGTTQALNQNADSANFYAIWQFRLLIIGSMFFIGWHILEMWTRTNAT